MKALLSVLLSVLFLQAQVFALSGGPNYNGNSSGGAGITDIVGTYGGVLVENTDPVDGTNGGSVAVYSVDIAATGTSAGKLVVFNSGRVYPGTMTGIGDATGSSATFKAIIEASFDYSISRTVIDPTTGVATIVTIPVTASTNGTLNTTLDTVRNGATSNVLMTGTATMNVSNGNVDSSGNFIIDRVIDYSVSGYKQTSTVASTTGA